ncbi:MAG: hypothetical protein AABX55_03325 [Nanoarchaeota archaeon]
MAEIDYVVPKTALSYTGILNVKELYSLIKSWLNEKGFYIIEKEHHGSLGETRNLKTKWQAEMKMEEYTKYVIKLTIKASNLHETNKASKFSGDFQVEVESYLEKDYEDRFESKPVLKFFRSVYDKFIDKSRFNKYEDELKDLTNMLRNELKAFFNLAKL